MRPEVFALRKNVRDFIVDKIFSAKIDGPVLEIGPMQLRYTPVKEFYVDTRRHFTERAAKYVSCDIDPDSGCDVTSDVLDLGSHFEEGIFGAIIALEVLEHTSRIWEVPAIFSGLLKSGGLLFLSTPYYFYRHHPFPDFWRVSEDGLRLLFEPSFELAIQPLLYDGDDRKPLQYTMVARKR